MKMKDVKSSYDIYELVYETEYYCSMDGAWTDDNDSLDSKLFLGLSDEGKQLFAMQHAKEFATEVLEWSIDEFKRFYGDAFDEIIEAE